MLAAVNAQLSLLGREEPSFARSLDRLERRELSENAWIEYMPGFVEGHARLCEELARRVAWAQTTQHLYDKEVLTPRLVGMIEDAGKNWPVLAAIAAALSDRYHVEFDRISCAYYRSGEDSVAWHRDRVLRNLPSGFVATVSTGDPRPFLMRPRGGGKSIRFNLGMGDLFVMGGTCQRTWEHTVPKQKSVPGPRISVMFRHTARI
jgi:alkylated DNA repair dioxygenase AlkB